MSLESFTTLVYKAIDEFTPDREYLQYSRQRLLTRLASQYLPLTREMDLDEIDVAIKLPQTVADCWGDQDE
jgi:hypothetical protein